MSKVPRVAILMGSDSDFPTVEPALGVLAEFGVSAEARVVSAHRSPDAMLAFGHEAAAAGYEVIIAAAGGAAHLPGMLASVTSLPVIGIPVVATALAGVDALLSIAQMPAGVPVATVGVGNAVNAALLAVRILAVGDAELTERLAQHRAAQVDKAAQGDAAVAARTGRTVSEPAPE